MTNAERLLHFLNKNGIGYYERIDPLLKEMFSEDDYANFISLNTRGRIWGFLLDLRQHQYINYKSERQPHFFVKAAIQPKGVQHLLEISENKKQAAANPNKKKIRWDIIGLLAIIVTILLWAIDRFLLKVS